MELVCMFVYYPDILRIQNQNICFYSILIESDLLMSAVDCNNIIII